MKPTTAAALIAIGLLHGKTADAHRLDEYLQATMVSLQADRVQAAMRLIPGVAVAPAVIAEIDSDGDGALSAGEEQTYAQRVVSDLSITIDGRSVQPELVSWDFPQAAQMRAGIGEIQIHYTVDLPPGGPNRTLILANHHLNNRSVYLVNVLVPQDPSIRILSQKRDARQSLYELDYQQTAADTPAGAAWGVWLSRVQFSSLFHLGMRHIAEGTDHLLFLLALLLPAPLLASGACWGSAAGLRPSLVKILGIVTAFTLGHSITLVLAAQGLVHVPQRPIEALIAASILVSAVHAFRPVFPGKETWIAAFFGLIHGLAFATVLARLGLVRWDRVAGILSFNLGIEAMQVVVVAMVLPSLLLLSATRAYSLLRSGGAVFAAVASLGWMVQRLADVQTPVDAVVNALARHALWIAITGFVVSLAVHMLHRSSTLLRMKMQLKSGRTSDMLRQ